MKLVIADKTKQLVIIKKEQYKEKMERIVGDKEPYNVVNHSVSVCKTDRRISIVYKLIKYKYIDNKEKKSLYIYYYLERRMKIFGIWYKEDFPIRQIVDVMRC